jgi:hypothetical protein
VITDAPRRLLEQLFELNAAKRLLPRLRREHPKLPLLLPGDAIRPALALPLPPHSTAAHRPDLIGNRWDLS